MRVVYDIETDGFIKNMTRIHLLVASVDGEIRRFHEDPNLPREGNIQDGVSLLNNATELVGHNVVGFDNPVLEKFGGFKLGAQKVTDTLRLSRTLYPSIAGRDGTRVWPGQVPTKLYGKHSLESWGHRLRQLKGDYGDNTDWSELDADMLAYCVRDVELTARLLEYLERQVAITETPLAAIDVEDKFANICERITAAGFTVDQKAGDQLLHDLMSERVGILQRIQETPLFAPELIHYVTPKTKKARTKTKDFNPGSRQQIAQRLKPLGWEPLEKTPTGLPKVDDEELRETGIPEAVLVADYLLIQKRISQLEEGSKSILKSVGADGRSHCTIIHNGAITHRSAHYGPNLAQVPSGVKDPVWGPRFRKLFVPQAGWKLVGADAEGLELRMLAHYVNNPTFTEAVVSGTKEAGTDAHTINMKKIQEVTHDLTKNRDTAKRALYAMLYGAGDKKLAATINGSAAQAKLVRHAILDAVPGLRDLLANLNEALVRRGMARWMERKGRRDLSIMGGAWLRGLDGRPVDIRSPHAILNTLLQSAGAIVMKYATVLFDVQVGKVAVCGDYNIVMHVHDEIQIECRPEIAQEIGALAARCITEAGELLAVRCPLAGAFSVGDNWNETH